MRTKRDAYERERVEPFAASRERRDARFANKDAVTLPVLQQLAVANPQNYFAVLMPSLWGPELFLLQERGVPTCNMFAIERDPQTHARYLSNDNETTHLNGIRTTRLPADAIDAIDEIPFGRVNLMYLDFFGQPDYSHYVTLYRVFRRRLLVRGASLLLTFGRNRGDTFACLLNKQLRVENPTVAYVAAALEATDHPRFVQCVEHTYRSGGNPYSLTEMQF